MATQTEADKQSPEAIAADIEEDLARGNFRQAQMKFDYCNAVFQDARASRIREPLKAKLSAIAARLYFYRGNDRSAGNVLNKYLKRESEFLSLGSLRTGQKLVLCEYYYAKRKFDKAISMAQQVLKACVENKDPSGEGEAHHFIARCFSRLFEQDELLKSCEESRACFFRWFTVSTNRSRDLPVLNWRIGISYLLEGFSLWREGNALGGRDRLLAAQLLLEDIRDDISKANVLQSLGAILRSQGETAQSLVTLSSALELYNAAHHSRNIARTLTNIGRTLLRDQKFAEAETHFNKALEICRTHRYERQKIEIWVALGWLYLEDTSGNCKIASKYAMEALDLAAPEKINSPELQAEAKICLGKCHSRNGEPEEACQCFEDALKKAKSQKLKINAHLLLADTLWDLDKPRHAMEHLDDAEDMFPRVVSDYLRAQAERIRRKIEDSKKSYFLMRFNDLDVEQGGMGLEAATFNFERWAILRALKLTGDNQTKAAAKLGMYRQLLKKRLDRPRPYPKASV
jgi:tetratricopeptide (TPR) repeat protein